MPKYLGNAFSLNMLAELDVDVSVRLVSRERAAQLAADTPSAVGHPDTARVFAQQLGVDVPAQRVSVVLERGESLLVGQYLGPRLPEGATELPDGAQIEWIVVTIQ